MGMLGLLKIVGGYKYPLAPHEFDVLKNKIKPAIEFLRKFYKYTIDGLPQSGQKILQTDTNSRWNTFIDLEIIGETLLSNSLLVTNEADIIDAYKECGKKNLVFTNNEYFQQIGINN